MGVTNYFSVDGEVIAESGSAGYLSYHRDNLGSVCATLDSSGALVHQYQYKPFGELWSATGAGAQERRLQWCGSWGFSAIALTRKFLSYYVRARHYAAILGNWTSVDPLWPSEMAYGYVENRVMTGVDYWGMMATSFLLSRPWERGGPQGTRLIGPYKFDPDRDCECFGKRAGTAKRVPNPTFGYHIVPAAGVPLNYRPDLSQDCFDRACKAYCDAKKSIDKHYDSLNLACGSGDLSAMSSAKAINSRIPPCVAGNPFWKECIEEPSSHGMWQARPHQSAYPNPSRYWSEDFCAVECQVRICCAKKAALSKLRSIYRPRFDNCYYTYTFPNGGFID